MKSTCCNAKLIIKEKSGQKCLYCSTCGKWIKNANKDDLLALENEETDTIEQIKKFIATIDSKIELEYAALPTTHDDGIRKSTNVSTLYWVTETLRAIINEA